MDKFPELDEYDRPIEKLPDCPSCEEDELGVINAGTVLCYFCGWKFNKPIIQSAIDSINKLEFF